MSRGRELVGGALIKCVAEDRCSGRGSEAWRVRLTGLDSRANMRKSMAQRITGTTRFLTWALALAIAVVSAVTCVLGAEASQEQMACCAAMNHDCGTAAIEHDCCATEGPAFTSLASGTVASPLAAPAPSVNLIATAPDFSPCLTASCLDTNASPLSRRPTYLLVSVFRL